MNKYNGTLYKAAWDRSTWFVIALVAGCCLVIGLFEHDLVWPMVISLAMLVFVILCFIGIYYRIDGDRLIVYTFYIPKAYPIKEIKTVGPTDCVLPAPAPSLSQRLAITFSSPTIMKSAMPLVISPTRQQEFIWHLLAVNPEIVISMT